ncbi:MAG: M28 family peptidase [Promethearchaeota archaeon]
MENVKYSLDWVTKICKEIGPRIATSEEEKKAADDLKKELEQYADEIVSQKFKAIPGLYPAGFVKLAIIFSVIGIPFILVGWPFIILSYLLPIFSLFIFVSSFMYMKEWFGFFFKSGESQNVLGRIYPRDMDGNIIKEPKKRIIMAGHIDSAYEMKIVRFQDNIAKYTFLGMGFIIITLLLGLIKSILIIFVPKIILTTKGPIIFTYIDILWVIFAVITGPFLVLVFYGYLGKKPVEGANDNLISVGLALALARYFSRPEHRLRNVELILGGFGSEECGERGSNAFVKDFGSKGLLDNSYTLIPESCGAGERLGILTGEKSHLATHSKEVYERAWKAYLKYKEEKGDDAIPCDVKKLPYAASDAGRFSLAGYKASTILAYEGKLMKPANWHAITDTPENLDPKFVEAVYKILKNFIYLVEEEEDQN